MSCPHLNELESKMEYVRLSESSYSMIRHFGECILELNQKIDALTELVNKSLNDYALEKIKQMGKY